MLTVEHKEEPRHTCPSSLLYVVTNRINKTDLHHPLCAMFPFMHVCWAPVFGVVGFVVVEHFARIPHTML